MRVLLVNPPFMRFRRLHMAYFPLSLGYVAAALREAGHEVTIYNAEVGVDREESILPTGRNLLDTHADYVAGVRDPEHPIWEEYRSVLRSQRPDVVGVTVMTCKFESARMLSELARESSEDITVVWGGPHPTAMPEECLGLDCVQYVVPREGELAAVGLLEHLAGRRPLSEVPGVLRRGPAGGIERSAPQRYVDDLDSLPHPARDALLFPEREGNRALGALITSRGCPFACTFCDSQSVWTRTVRNRSPENVLEEVSQVHTRFGQAHFNMVDDTFTLNRKRVLRFCQELKSAGPSVSWTCTTRADVLDLEMLVAMKGSGCTVVTIGIESGSDRLLRELKKGITVSDVLRAAALLEEADLDWHAFFMIGLPKETRADIEATRDLIERIQPGRVELSVFTPYPGAEEWQVAESLGLIQHPVDWSRFSHQSPENHFVHEIPKEEFRQISQEMFELVDRRNNSLRTNLRKFRRRYSEFVHNPWYFATTATRVLRRRLGK